MKETGEINIVKVGLAVIKDRQLLMVRGPKHGETFITLGGKIEPGEDDIQCLVREVKEEADTEVDIDSLESLGVFKGAILGRDNTFVTIRLYKGKLLGEPTPSSEIEEIRYFSADIAQRHLTPASKKIFAWLKEHDYVD